MIINTFRNLFSRAKRLMKAEQAIRQSKVYPQTNKRVEPIAQQKNIVLRRLELTPYQLWLINSKSMERPFTGHLWSEKQMGYYSCVVCNTQVFSWSHKYFPATGMASFWSHIPGKIKKVPEEVQLDDCNYTREGKNQTRHERAQCSTCNSHLGAVFFDGPAPTHLRYSINSACLDFRKIGEFPDPHIARKEARLQAQKAQFVPLK